MEGAAENDQAGDPKPFAEWIGRRTIAEDVVTERLDASFRAVFEPHLFETGEGVAPLGLHWCLSPRIAPMGRLGADGHPALNLDLPPVPQPRRMWAGGSIETLDALRVGDRVRRVSTVARIERKTGRSGELWFVAVDHDYSTERGLAIRERQDIVYREAARPPVEGTPAAGSPPTSGAARRFGRSWSVETPPVLLFRYSAITFNGHRVHYDLPYATGVEGYRGLLVHGPLQATLLLNLAAETRGAVPRIFRYRAFSPAIAGDALCVRMGVGTQADIGWTQGPSGEIRLEAWSSES